MKKSSRKFRACIGSLISMIMVHNSAPAQNGWTAVNADTSISFSCVSVVDENIAWAAGDSGRAFRTTNAGSTWMSAGGGAIGQVSIYAMDATGENIALVTTTPGSTTFIYRTTNGGTSWSQVFSQSGGFINGIRMIDSLHGYAYGDPVQGKWTVLQTGDGGATWAHIANEPASRTGEFGLYYNSLAVPDSNHIWFCATAPDSQRIYRSTDGGASWISVSLGSRVPLSVWFNTDSLGACSQNIDGSRTTDGGASWSRITLPGSSAPYLLAGAGTLDFWYGSASNIYRSADGAQTWMSEHVLAGSSVVLGMDFKTMGAVVVGYAAGLSGAIARFNGIVTSVGERPTNSPNSFSLGQNYPNPFNPMTTIPFSLAHAGQVTLSVFNIAGEEVATIASGRLSGGDHSAVWDASAMPSGVYFYQLRAGIIVQQRKLLLIK